MYFHKSSQNLFNHNKTYRPHQAKAPVFGSYNRSLQSDDEILSSVSSRLLDSIGREKTKRINSAPIYFPMRENYNHLGEFSLELDNGIKNFILLDLGKGSYMLQKKHQVDKFNNPLQVNIVKITPDGINFHAHKKEAANKAWSEPFYQLFTEDKKTIENFFNFISQIKK